MEIRKLENSAVELTLRLEASAIEDAYSKKLGEYAKKLTLKGFRPGKAPVSVVENKLGKDIREEVTFNLMEENLKDSYKDMDEKDRPLPYSTPVLQDEDKLLPFKPDTDITYSVVYDVMPSFELPQYTGLKLQAKVEKISDSQVDAEIERIRQQNALVIAKDGAVEKSDIVTMDYAELDADGNDVEGTKRADFTFTVGSSYNFYKLDDDIVGMKKGDSSVIEKTYGDDSGMGTDYLGKTVKIRVTIKDIKQREVPELDDDFAQDVKDSYKTLADMKADIRKQLEEETDQANRNYKLEAVLKAISEKTDIVLPKSMVDTQLEEEWRQFASRFGMSAEDVEKFMSANGQSKAGYLETIRESTVTRIKNELILEKVSEQQKFEFTDEEVDAKLKEYGNDINSDNPNYDLFRNYAKDDLSFSKTREYLIENNSFTELKEDKESRKDDEK